MPNDLFERANIRRWICYLSDNILPLYNTLFTKLKEGKPEELDANFLKLQENWDLFVSNCLLVSGKNYLFGDNLSLADFATLPFLNNQNIIVRKIFKKNLFESKDEKVQEKLNLLKKYLEFAEENTEFLIVNKNIRVVPSEEKDPIIKDLGMKTMDKYDYEEYIFEVYSRAFLGK